MHFLEVSEVSEELRSLMDPDCDFLHCCQNFTTTSIEELISTVWRGYFELVNSDRLPRIKDDSVAPSIVAMNGHLLHK